MKRLFVATAVFVVAWGGLARYLLADPGKIALLSKQQYLESRLQLIERARRSILITTFTLKVKDQASQQVLQALLRKKKEIPDIDIRIKIDSKLKTSRSFKKEIKNLRKHGIQVGDTDLLRAGFVRTFLKMVHEKLFIVDGDDPDPSRAFLIIGGTGYSDAYLDPNHPIDKSWQDFEALLTGKIAQKAYGDMIVDFDAKIPRQDSDHSGTDSMVQQQANLDESPHPVLSDKHWYDEDFDFIFHKGYKLGSNSITETYNDFIRRETKHIQIVNPYIVSHRPTRKALSKAIKADQGPKVTLLTNSGATSDWAITTSVFMDPQVRWLRKRLKWATKYKDRIHFKRWVPELGTLHAKIATFEGLGKGIVGSFNLDFLSREMLSEAVIVIHQRKDQGAVSALAEKIRHEYFEPAVEF